jgi:class 3 adenylate cyclase
MTEPPENSENSSLSGVSAPDVSISDESVSDESVSDAVDAANSTAGSSSTSDNSVSGYSAPEEAPSGETSERRLAAILFADVAGYTALSSHDEDLALALIRSFQRVSKKIVAEKGGRVVKFLGDGMLAEFSSLDAAVNAAHSLQNSFPHIEEVKESRVSLRVGVHLGDIVFGDDGDVYGSGVNVASRIEGHAPLSGVVISDSAYQQLRHRKHYQFSSLGEKDLKGVPDPMELYVVLLAGQELPTPAVRVPETPPVPAKRPARKRWVALGLAAAAGGLVLGTDLGGVQGRSDQVLRDLGLPAVFVRSVFAQTPGYRSIEGGAAVDGDITVAFSGLINPVTATGSSVQLLGPGGVLVPAEVSASVDASAIDITPLTPLSYTTRYRIVLTRALLSASGGGVRPPRGEGSPEDLLSFVTQPTPPEPPALASSEPTDGSTGADGDGPVFATFNKPMNPLTLDSTTVILMTEGGARVAATLTCCGDDEGTLRVDPLAPMNDGVYRLALGDGITDAGGRPMDSDTFAFRVGVEARRVAPTGPGRLTVEVIPASLASRTIVVIDGDTVGPAPVRDRAVSQGTPHRVEIFGTSLFSPRTIRIYDAAQTLSPAERVTLSAEVTPFGTVSIDSTPGGRVFIDGEEIGPTALVTYPVAADVVHTLEVRPIDGDAETRTRYRANFTVGLLEDKSLGRVELPAR